MQAARHAHAVAAAARPASYTVRPGDSLSAIAGHLFGNPAKWPYLYDANLRVVGDNPDRIVPGMVLAARLGSHAAYGTAARTARGAPSYTVRRGDSLASISARKFGSMDRWPYLYAANRHAVGGNPSALEVGTVLSLHLASRPAYGTVTAVSSGGYQARHARVHYRGSPARRHHYRSYSSSGTYHGSGSMEHCIIAAESGGDSQVMNSSGHYGLYQFSASTWQAHGGSAATFGHASVGEQRRVFQNTVAVNGYRDWTPYDGC
jgi:hypothetical protein